MSSSASLLPNKTEFTVRMVVCDHYLTKPAPDLDVIYSDFRGADIKQVPILRIFGPTPDGHKACVHVHGVFPYFYIPCPTPNPEPQFLYQIAASLDKALNIALKQASSSNQHVYKITLVKGLPFYGFHDREHIYLKVFLYSPGLIKQAVELCSNGAILGQTFQPHESHINFTLQFFIDFNLFGMSNIDFQKVVFRRLGLSQKCNEPFDNYMSSLKPESTCFYEADCIASHIINRQRIGKGDGIENPGLEEVWNQEIERRKKLNISLASKSLSQVRINTDETESHNKFREIFLLKISSVIDKPVYLDHEIDRIKEICYYPAESVEDSQLLNAVDISVHLPGNMLSINRIDTSIRDLDLTYTEEADDTLVDENVALNSSLSLQYSQILLNGEDLELVDMLQEMVDSSIEEDSIMRTPADDDIGDNSESDDAEYSQIFQEDTILLDTQHSKGDANKSSLSWNDTFWNDANIPQLDGTCDDDHVKKVRKRKLRSFKLGLSKPKSKNKPASESPSNEDEINASREIIDSISHLHLRKSTRLQQPDTSETIVKDISITNLVDAITQKHNDCKLKSAEIYDLKKKYFPEAGSSTNHIKIDGDAIPNNLKNTDVPFNSSHLGIESFYNDSKIFNISSSNDISDDNTLTPFYSTNKGFIPSPEDYEKYSNVNSDQYEHFTRVNHEKEKSSRIINPKLKAPLKSYVASTLQNYKIPKVKHPQPFFSDHKDVGDRVEIGQVMLKLQSRLSRDQKLFNPVLDTTSIEEWRQLFFLQSNNMSPDTSKPDSLKLLLAGNKKYILEPIKRAPSRKMIEKSLTDKNNDSAMKKKDIAKRNTDVINEDVLDNSQALGLNEDLIDNSLSDKNSGQDNTINSLQITMQPDGSFLCFGSHDNGKESFCDEAAALDVNFLTLMFIEVHTSVRGELYPDPIHDPIEAIFYTVTNDSPTGHFLPKSYTGILVIDNSDSLKNLDRCVQNIPVTYVNNECEIIEKVIELVRRHDPDIMCGYEIEMNSWGYVFERAQLLGMDIVTDISRITEKYRQKRWRNDDKDFEGRIIGRVIFNVWRLLRHELALSSYSFENCMYEVLKERVPTYSYAQLSEWWSHESRIFRWIPVDFYLTRLTGTVRLLEKLDIINRTSELARLFGLQWWEVLSRGSQFRVESLMLRAARPLNLIALSPTVKQRSKMRAPECLPLIFEPESRFYSDPVIVLDFQSLYPSMMIAYNYCFSTCIGRVQNITGDSAYEFGTWRLKIPKSTLEALAKNDLVNWSPVGVGFVKPSVRRGVLPALLRRILAARQAVKKNMKMQTDEAVKKAMHSRQLGLKLIANVTYGYTSANFSGRMPCVEVGDSVVAKGRETLERAIKLVRNNSKWNAKVVYGDTDSMFVLIPGGTRAEAFEIGQEIADAVTADNPSPVALKLEKVYQPCILQTKKRYVGYMYESPDQENPIYEAKGIETVRRDGCPAGVKLLRESLCELFSSGDMSRVKKRVQAVLSQLAEGTLPAHQLLFTREYHGAAGYRPAAVAPPREIAMRIGSRDKRAVPRTGWRVSWLVTAGAPGAPLVRLARTPKELLRDPSLRPHVAYYAARVLLPPLHRCLSLLGVDVFKWWNELGYTRTAQQREISHAGGIVRYMSRERCAICGARVAMRAGATDAVCADCAYTQRAAATLATRYSTADTLLNYSNTICKSCCGHSQISTCENTECPVLWKRLSTSEMLLQIHELLSHLPSQSVYF